MSGLSCAYHLQNAGVEPVVFEKSGRIGGRMSTRVTENGYAFDHGAQFFRAKGDDFAKFVDVLKTQDRAKVWMAEAKGEQIDPSNPMMVAKGAMNELLSDVSHEMNIRFRTHVETVTEVSSGVEIRFQKSDAVEVFDQVVSTIPVQQVRQLMQGQDGLLHQCREVSLLPCWAGLFGFAEKIEIGFDTWRHVNSDIGWIARNSSKPDRDHHHDAWVVHASPEWSLENLERDKEDVAQDMLDMFGSAMSVSLPAAEYVGAHRWRYAQTPNPLGKPFVTNEKGTLYVGGDWCLGARVEAAFDSGTAIANAILSRS